MAEARDNGGGAPLAGLNVRAWVLTDGKIGDEVPCFGLAEALGLTAERRIVRPRALFAALAPHGPIDLAERPDAPRSPLAPPFPEILIASGRRAIPYLRHARRAAGGATYTIFLKNPRIDPRVADLVWAARHDGLSGANVVSTLTAPHGLAPAALARARAAPDPRLAGLPRPRVALLVGGPSNSHRYDASDMAALLAAAASLHEAGASLMITPSRRTPRALREGLTAWAGAHAGRAFFWDGAGDNPYVGMLALADAVLVTADSTNMVGEAAATSAPVMVYEPSGGHPRLTRYLDDLVAEAGLVRWRGRLETRARAPFDATEELAREVARRYRAWRADRVAPPRVMR